MFDSYKDSYSLVTGGAGFIGSHLVEWLLSAGSRVTVVDNLVTGKKDNLSEFVADSNFEFIEADVSGAVTYLPHGASFDFIFHLASPASPKDFSKIPVEIYSVNAFGTHFLAQYAKQVGARLLLASTSEAYGDPLEHPQKEDYFGNVNPVGPRACYDESKRFAEMVVTTLVRQHQLEARIVRIFNTYGPRMNINDGRVIPNFVSQALRNEPLTIHGDGRQTRSFCYVSDLVEYMVRVMISHAPSGEIYNIGNPDEYTMLDVAEKVISLTGSSSETITVDAPQDDPQKRRPDCAKVIDLTGYTPQVSFNEGLSNTIAYFEKTLER